jgi:hypothetical protein
MKHLFAGAILSMFIVSAHCQPAPAQDECTARANSDGRLTPLREKLPAVINNPTMQQLAEHSRPTKLEKKALIAYDEDRSFCEDQFGSKMTGQIGNAFSLFVSESKKLRAKLYGGEIDFGTFVGTDSDNLESFLNYMHSQQAQEKAQADAAVRAKQQQEANERLANEQLEQQQEQFEADQKRQKLQAFADALQQAGRAFQRPVPVTTNCNTSYGNTRCTTY